MFIIDRFENGWAVIETSNKETFKLPSSLLPEELQEGDCIRINVDYDQEADHSRKDKASKILGSFFDD